MDFFNDDEDNSNSNSSNAENFLTKLDMTPTRVPAIRCYPSPRTQNKVLAKNKSSPVSSGASKLFPIFQRNFMSKENALKVVQTDTDKVTPKKRKRTMLGKDTDGLTQTILDAGQKNIGPTFCEECGMLYSPGDFVDEEEHRRAHIRISNTFQITLWKDTKIIFNYPDGCQIIMVQCNAEPQRVMQRLKEFLAWLDSELGVGYDPSGYKNSERIFLYVARTSRKNVVKILGCGIVEIPDPSKIATSRLVKKDQSNDAMHETNSQDDDQTDQRDEPKILIGITRLWTDSGFRRKNIASRLCEMMRFNNGILGCVVPKESLGILEPSEAGKAFMINYTESQGAFYTYKFK